MRKLRFLDAAAEDIASISGYIAEASGSAAAGERFAEQLLDRCADLASLPGTMGRPRPELRADLRSSVFKGHVIFFRYIGDTFEVVSVLEGHRDIDAFFEDG